MDPLESNRRMMKSQFGSPGGPSDQQKGLAHPPVEKPCDPKARRIDLPEVDPGVLTDNSLYGAINRRCSRRRFAEQPLSLEELSFLLWATQGVHRVVGDGHATMRTVPSAGARHAFETYLAALRVADLRPGLYRYLALSHQLVRVGSPEDLAGELTDAALGQHFAGTCAVVFFWSCIPYRGEWRYHRHAHKVMLLDAGHVAQNLYLAAEAVSCGTCAIGAYDQRKCDDLLQLDGKDEFVIYLAAVGKV
jgi:SagB-type dehydrogenase family enzyme